MSASQNESLGCSLYAMWNERAFDKMAAQATDDAVISIPPIGQVFRGQAGFRQSAEAWATAFPDAKVEVTNVVASETGFAVEFVGRGTHGGVLKTPMGDIPPTGRHVEVPFIDIYEVRDGKITGGRTYFDTATMMRQLGMMPEPAAAS